ncbi:MAG: TRAP transporter fused permease subunit [Rhodospirillaceae bacterium]|jgi:TRAP transporter 4TM/12TM fusion protein|nr:TRAP transporter fused permease subunit [Rhodospirillaceae bacterium]MBT5456419.1 TRAP transporter fused permease subunit [Rhodospirillaceae bacterium]
MAEELNENTAQSDSRAGQMFVNAAAALITITCVLWAIEAQRWFDLTFFPQSVLALILGFSVFIAWLSMRANRTAGGTVPWYDWIGATVGLATLLFISLDYERLSETYGNRTDEALVLGVLVLATVLEALRRTTGYALLSVVGVFFIFALLGHYVPGDMKALEVGWNELVTDLGLDAGAAYGTPLQIGAEVVVVFIFFGQLLLLTGGGEFFTNLAMAGFGKRRGGAAKISVVASALFGSISGSATSNVASTGVITIPLMQRSGYSAENAGAIEAVASTGGQFMPPIMGAAAFLMAEFLEIEYQKVVLAALIPALLYYFAVFVQVDLIAAKEKISVADSDLPDVRKVLREGWHLIIPFVVLLVALFEFWVEAQEAAIYACIAIVVLGMFRSYAGQKITLASFLSSFVNAGKITVELILILASAGFVIFIISTTGFAFALTQALVALAGQNVILLLIIAAITCIILGMGMPTSGVYVLLAFLVAPAIVEAGIEPMAAHLFILYFGMMSMITPPVALCAFTAAALTGASAMTTAVKSMKFAWTAFIIPFVFVFGPGLLMIGDTGNILLSIATAAIGVYLISVSFAGYFSRELNGVTRLLLVVAGFAALTPASATSLGILADLAGVALGALVLLREYYVGRRLVSGAAE